MEKLEIWQIEVGDFAFLCWKNYERRDLFVIKSIISSESGNVILCENPIDPTDVVTFVEGPEGITYEYSIKFDSFKFRRRDSKFLDNLTSDNVELSDELMDLIGKTYSSPRGEITMTIPLLYQVSKNYNRYSYSADDFKITIMKYPEELFIDLYYIDPIDDFKWWDHYDDDDYDDTGGAVGIYYELGGAENEWHFCVCGIFAQQGKYKYVEVILDDIPWCPDDYEKTFDYFNKCMKQDFSCEFLEYFKRFYGIKSFIADVSFEKKEKVLNLLLEYGAVSELDLFDINDCDSVNILANTEWGRNPENTMGFEIASKAGETLLFSGFQLEMNVNILSNLSNHRNFFFRNKSEDDIHSIVEVILKKYISNRKDIYSIPEGDDNDLFFINLINTLKEPIMTKSALKR